MAVTEHLTEVQVREQLQALDMEVGRAIEESWSAPALDGLLERLSIGGGKLFEAFRAIGEACFQQLEVEGRYAESEAFLYYLINFEWAEEAKAFLLLWRDVLFQLQKAGLLLSDGVASEAALRQLEGQSREAVRLAAESLKVFVSKASRPGGRWQPSRKARIDTWRLQKNPWPVYQEQLGQLARQCSQLLRQYQELNAAASVFQNIRSEVARLTAACQTEIAGAQENAEKALGFFEEGKAPGEEPRLGKIATRLEALASQVQPEPHLFDFTNALDREIERLPEKIQIVLNIRGGTLEMVEMNLQKRTRQWLESELLPSLKESWELAENGVNGLKVAISNIRNRAILLSGENKEGKKMEVDTGGILLPIEGFRKIAATAEAELSSLSSLIDKRLGADFRLSAVYDTKGIFLPVPLQSSINQFRIRRNKWLVRLQEWLAAQARAVRKLQLAAEQEENRSVSEKVVRYIQNRKVSPENSHYGAIFQAQGYIGESFWVGREEEMQHIKSIIDNWENGFRGAVAITGKRFSGKSFFGELVSNHYFAGKTIRLLPDSVIEVQGRKMEAGYDLEEVLEFVRKNTLNQRPLVWIDDLELWWSPAIPLNQNLRALRRYIDDHSNSIFFLMSMGNVLKAHLQKYHEIGRLFLSELNMDYVPAQVVRDAILIRHGATHSKLVDENGEEVAPPKFNRLAGRVHRLTEGNIGEALVHWALFTRKVEESIVAIEPRRNFTLPDFLGPDSAVLLCAIMIQKRTNEYRLRKSLGPSFSDKYLNILQRLLSVGLLIRRHDGWLEADEGAVNAVGALLESKNYIKYRQWKQ